MCQVAVGTSGRSGRLGTGSRGHRDVRVTSGCQQGTGAGDDLRTVGKNVFSGTPPEKMSFYLFLC